MVAHPGLLMRMAGLLGALALVIGAPQCGGPGRTGPGAAEAPDEDATRDAATLPPAGSSGEASGAGRSTGAPRVAIRVGGHLARVEVVSTPEGRERGLMFREALEPDTGMLFVFPDEAPRSFWMKNTLVPLSIAYLRTDGTINEILDMAPQTTTSHRSRLPARYALEMAQGWFGAHFIRPGDRVELPAGVREAPVR